MAGLGPVAVKLGAIERQTSNFDQFKEIDGVLGFTMGGASNAFAQLVAAGKCDNVWAICMHEGSVSNGTLTIGGADPSLSDGPIAYVPDSGRGFHSVRVKTLEISGATLQVDKSAILDTGTNVLLLPSSLLAAAKTSMCSNASLIQCKELWENKCVELSEAQVDAYPSLSMNLDGTTLEMTSRDYLLLGSPMATSAGQYCLGIRDGGAAGGSGFIIGDTTMRNYYLVFDLASRRIGWGRVNPARCGSVRGTQGAAQSEVVV